MADSTRIWESPSALTIYEVAESQQSLGDDDGKRDWLLDLSAVTEIDSAGVQLLLYYQQSMAEQGRQMHIKCSAVVEETLQLMGLQELMTPPSQTSSAA